MISRRKCSSTTLVLLLFVIASSASAAPDVSVPVLKDTRTSEQPQPPDGLKEMTISPTPQVEAPEFDRNSPTVYFPYESSISPRLGLGTDTKRIKSNEYYYQYGVLYQFASDNGKHWEAGADVLNDGTGVISVGRKIRMNYTEAVRPYFKVGGAIHVNPSEQLTTFLRTENFRIQPSAGFEYFLEHPSSVRLELESWISTKAIGFHFTVGFSYAF